MGRVITAALSCLALTAAMAGAAQAQTYPAKPIRMLVPFAGGSITDILARTVGQAISQSMGQPVIIDNKPGADGLIAAQELLRAAPDGYTLMMGTNSPLSVAPHLQKQQPYGVADFSPISFVGDSTFLIVAHPSVPAKTLKELMDYAKANPKKVTYATGNTTSIVSTALLAKAAGVDMIQVPYKSEPQAAAELLAGQTNMMIGAYTSLAAYVKDGKLNALSTALPVRTPLMPDVPSLVEAGFPKFPIGPWGAVVGPAKLPPEIVERLNKEVVAALAKPEVQETFQRAAFMWKSSTPAELGEFLKQQFEAYGKALKEAGIEPQ